MTLGITVGKFYPFHLGHDYLIREAKKQVDTLVVLVGYKPTQGIPGDIRANWIRLMHPDVEVIEVKDDLPEAPEPWAQRALEILGSRRPDIAFTSEAYGEPWARFMGARHQAIDPPRLNYPISGTQLRAALAENWQMLTPGAKAYFAKRVCVLGVESSGTTTLAIALAQHYQTVWVPEYGRWYWEGRRYAPKAETWDSYEFVQITQGQLAIENALATRANKLVICDTDPAATYIWHRRYLGYDSPLVEQIARSCDYDLYILTEPDFEFVQDGTRESEHLRQSMHQDFIEMLENWKKPYITVGGDRSQRISKAVEAIAPLLIFQPLIELSC